MAKPTNLGEDADPGKESPSRVDQFPQSHRLREHAFSNRRKRVSWKVGDLTETELIQIYRLTSKPG